VARSRNPVVDINPVAFLCRSRFHCRIKHCHPHRGQWRDPAFCDAVDAASQLPDLLLLVNVNLFVVEIVSEGSAIRRYRPRIDNRLKPRDNDCGIRNLDIKRGFDD